MMRSGSVFKSNTSQAVRLPKSVAFDPSVTRVDIIEVGRGRLIVPSGEGWDSWFDAGDASDDYMSTRDQPAFEEREEL